jgi:ComF family protein
MSSAGGLWTNFSRVVLDAIYPPKCPLCMLLTSSSPCPACREEFVEYLSPTTEELALDYRVSLFRYEGRAAQAVRKLKYSRSTSLAAAMASDLAETFAREGLDPDVVVPVPIHWTRRCFRGFNQSDLLCEQLSNVKPSTLVRVRRTRPQVGLSREERERNIRGAFRASPSIAGRRVLLVDDVFTSGHTARECANALRSAGATEVGILTFCAGDR